ncbi:MAG: PAS domain S-box protein, partial [Methylococcus sp.]
MTEPLLPWSAAEGFLPHSFCLLQKPALILLHVVSDGMIALAYLSIPVALALFVRRRKDLVFSRVFVLFAAFILACAATHLMDIWTLWHPDYLVQGLIKAVTALVSVATAVVLWPVLEQALKLPSPSQLAELNAELGRSMDELRDEVESRKLLEAQLRESERQLKTVLDTAADGIVTTDARGRIVLSNPAAARMFGYSAEQLAERSLAELTSLLPQPEDADAASAGNVLSGADFIGLRRDGSSFPLEMTLGGNTHVLRDISARKEQEQAIRKLNASLEQKVEERTRQLAQASAAKSQFLANMSHELRTPLNAILGFGQLLQKRVHDPEQQTILRQMRSAGDALVRIIDDILDITRIEADQVRLEQRPFCVADCLAQVEGLMQGAARDKALRLLFGPVERLPRPVLGDNLRLQ